MVAVDREPGRSREGQGMGRWLEYGNNRDALVVLGSAALALAIGYAIATKWVASVAASIATAAVVVRFINWWMAEYHFPQLFPHGAGLEIIVCAIWTALYQPSLRLTLLRGIPLRIKL